MTAALNRFQELLAQMSRADKVQALRLVARELGEAFPGIDRRPDVCGGAATIVRTRIPVWTLEQARRLGAGNDDLLRMYARLQLDDLLNAWAYVAAQPDEIERAITDNEAA